MTDTCFLCCDESREESVERLCNCNLGCHRSCIITWITTSKKSACAACLKEYPYKLTTRQELVETQITRNGIWPTSTRRFAIVAKWAFVALFFACLASALFIVGLLGTDRVGNNFNILGITLTVAILAFFPACGIAGYLKHRIDDQ